MYDLKHRFLAFLGFVFFSLLSLMISFFAFESMFKYFDNTPVIIFSAWSFFAAFSPLVTIPFLLMIIPVIAHGKQISTERGKKLMIFSMTSIVVILISTISFYFIYKYHLSVRGYIQCQGIPLGWTPGMATQYVLDESLCHN
ncbi:DUF1240 domain-containing protein (plasmid) [Enterobacteriaceae bacterium Kacie_13]|nr:DUF1240 domain-containing protein [Enterobacteriaceae bacterium Kacie_13]